MRTTLITHLLTLTLAGCIAPLPVEPDIIEPDIVQPDTPDTPSIAVTASPDAFAEIKGWLGASNTITVANATTIDRDAVTVNVPAGATVSYQFSEELGTFTFAKPLPTVRASVLGFKVSPSLSVVTLRPSGDGSAKTSLGTYRFKWLADDDAGAAATPSELPEVWAYSQPGCPPCVRARLELAAEKDLPFRIVWKDDAAPAWLATRPAFWWHTTGQQPTQADVANTRQVTGWGGVKDFTERWKNSRSPKRYQRTAASNTYQSGHQCPSCGRTQYGIDNDSGPVAKSHYHRCGSCNVTWWHADQ